MKKYIGLLFCTLIVQLSFGQIGDTKAQIISKYGKNFESLTMYNLPAMCYVREQTSKASGKHLETMFYLFQKDGTCVVVVIFIPETEFKTWSAFMNKTHQKISEYSWRDGNKKIAVSTITNEGKKLLQIIISKFLS